MRKSRRGGRRMVTRASRPATRLEPASARRPRIRPSSRSASAGPEARRYWKWGRPLARRLRKGTRAYTVEASRAKDFVVCERVVPARLHFESALGAAKDGDLGLHANQLRDRPARFNYDYFLASLHLLDQAGKIGLGVMEI